MESKRKILYVEDNRENIMLVRRILESKGYIVLEATNGLQGIEATGRERPDLVLMDINLPDLDGYSAATKIKNTKGLQHIPIVALTANVMKGDRERSLTAGCDGYIPKPIDIKTFPTLIEFFLAGKKETVGPEEEKAYLKEHTVKLVEKSEERIRELAIANEEGRRNLDKLQDRTNQLSLLLEFTTKISSSLELREMLQAAAKIMVQHLGVAFCRMILLNQDQNRLVLMAVHPQTPLTGELETSPSSHANESQCFHVIQKSLEPLLLREAKAYFENCSPVERLLLTGNLNGLQTVLICPISKKESLLGMVVLGETRIWAQSPFMPSKIWLCNSLARQLASAIENPGGIAQ